MALQPWNKLKNYTFFVSSSDSVRDYPDNKPVDFTIKLPGRLRFDDNWICTLKDIVFGNLVSEDLIVCCSLCNDSIFRDTELPILRLLISDGEKRIFEFSHDLPIEVKREETARLRIFIRTLDRAPPTFLTKPVRCTVSAKQH